MLSSWLWNVYHDRQEMQSLALAEARGNYNKDLLYRRWGALHGGVYVPVTEKTPPNPYLSAVPERDITTPSGRHLTLINPAYMMRQVHELGKAEYGIYNHLTSLNPIRAQNAPDEWERRALENFEVNKKEVYELTLFDGQAYLRAIFPLITEDACLKCHAGQGYKVGDVRGGLSVAVPLAPYILLAKQQRYNLTLTHFLLWGAGLIGIVLGTYRLGKRNNERWLAEAKLRASEASLAEAQRIARLGNWDWNIVTNELAWSEEIYRVFGLQPAEFGATYEAFLNAVHPEDRSLVQQAVDAALTERKPYNIDHRVVRPDGEEIHVHEQAEVTFDTQGKAIRMFGTVQDVTTRKLLQEQLYRSRLLTATGQLAASVAHEINSPLQGITALLSVMRQSDTDNQELQENLRLVSEAFERIRNTVRNLLDLNRPGTEKKQEINLNEVIKSTAALVRSHLQKLNIKLNLRLAADLPKVYASPPQFSQVLLNLINNAMEAIGALAPPFSGEITLESFCQGNNVVIKVTDNGPGVAPEYLPHVFEPFFTKNKTLGMGVGLSVCQGIIQKHQGTIEVCNAPTGGAIFTITLPVSCDGTERSNNA